MCARMWGEKKPGYPRVHSKFSYLEVSIERDNGYLDAPLLLASEYLGAYRVDVFSVLDDAGDFKAGAKGCDEPIHIKPLAAHETDRGLDTAQPSYGSAPPVHWRMANQGGPISIFGDDALGDHRNFLGWWFLDPGNDSGVLPSFTRHTTFAFLTIPSIRLISLVQTSIAFRA